MRPPALALLAAFSPLAALAQTPPPVAGTPVAESPLELVAVTTELLRRWGLDPERYLKLSVEQKLEVQRELSRREPGRLRRVALVTALVKERCAQPQDGAGRCHITDTACQVKALSGCDEELKRCVTPEGMLTAEGERLLAEYLAKRKNQPLAVPAQVKFERKDGKPLAAEDLARARVILDGMFDGVRKMQEAGQDLPSELDWDASVRNGTLRHLSVTNPKTGLSFEVGQLGIEGRSAILAPSWYGNLAKKWESGFDSWVDYKIHAQIGYVDLRARFFNDAQRGPDPRVGRTIDLMRHLGLSEGNAQRMRDYVTYDDAYRTQGMIVTSLLTEMGRAYNLFGPVDVSWTVGNLTRIVYLAPNTAFDETLGIRVKLKDNLFLGVFAGATQNLSPVGNRLFQDLMGPGKSETGLNVENAPHWTAAVWGQVPGISGLQFHASAGSRYNQDTTVRQGELALTTTLFERPLSLRGIASAETGPEIEFDRRKARAQLDYQLSDRALAYIAYEKDRIRYGNAEVDSDAFIAGFEILLGGPGRDQATITVDQLFGGAYKENHPLTPDLPQILTTVNRAMSQGLEAASTARDVYERLRAGPLSAAQMQTALDRLSYALQRLDPDTAARLVEELASTRLTDAQRRQLSDIFLRTVSRGSERYERLRGILAQALAPEGGREGGVARLQDEASEFMRRTLGRDLTAAERTRVNDFLESARRFAQGRALTPEQIAAFREQGVALIDAMAGRRLAPEQIAGLQRLLTTHAETLNDLLQNGGWAARADQWLGKIDDAVAFFEKHEPDIRELLALLGDKTLWDAVVVDAGRAALLKSLSKGKTVTIPLIDKDLKIKMGAPTMLAAANVLGSRLSPIAPLRQGEVEPWLLREAADQLGLNADQATEEMIAQALFRQAGAQLKQALADRVSSRLDPILRNLGAYDLQAAADRLLSALPPSLSARLQERYGQNLSGLLPANGTPQDQIREFLLTRLPDELMRFLDAEFGDEIARQVGELVGWAAELIRREINMTMIHLLLASEELNRLTVDKGLKISDLNVRMAMRSFDQLDRRSREEVPRRFRDAARRLAENAAVDEARLAARFMDYGKARLDALQLDPKWPRGLKVEIAEKDWLPLLTLYGDGELFALLDRIKGKYRETPEGLTVTLEFDEHSQFGTQIRPTGAKDAPAVAFRLGKPKDARTAAHQLRGLEDYAAEHQQECAAKKRFDAAQSKPDWPAGLSVDVGLGTLSQLARYYGEEAAYGLLERLAAGYPAGAKPFPVAIEFDYNGPEKPVVKADPKTGATVFVVGKPKDPKDAKARLSALIDAVYTRARTR